MKRERVGSDPIEESLKSPKVDSFIMVKYSFEGRNQKQGERYPEIGLIVEVESSDVELEGTVSRGKNHILVCVPYSKIPSIAGNPQVKYIDWGDDDLVKLVRSSTSDEIVLKRPWTGLKGDEWDSPAYSSFWDGPEKNLNERVLTLQKIGKKVKII